tara:strand:+ start:333 stop:617 length:285 start_codon:yes stop_codon:yes gene_type:complete
MAANGEKKKVVCIVGIAGFIGSHMLEQIIRERDWIVLGCDMVEPMKIQALLGAEKTWAGRFELFKRQHNCRWLARASTVRRWRRTHGSQHTSVS